MRKYNEDIENFSHIKPQAVINATTAKALEDSKQYKEKATAAHEANLDSVIELKHQEKLPEAKITLDESLFESINEGLNFLNNIDKDLLSGADKEFGDGQNLIVDNNIKCSKSVMNNIIYNLQHGKSCKLCLGSFVSADEEQPSTVAHVWVEVDGELIQTHVPNNIKLLNKQPKAIKCIEFRPSDLPDLKSILQAKLNESFSVVEDSKYFHGTDLINGEYEEIPSEASYSRYRNDDNYKPRKYNGHIIYRGVDHIPGERDRYVYCVDIKPNDPKSKPHITLYDAKDSIDRGWYDKDIKDESLTEIYHEGEWRLNTQESDILDKVFGYLRDRMDDEEFAEFAMNELGMDAEDLLYYCDINLDRAENSRYPAHVNDELQDAIGEDATLMGDGLEEYLTDEEYDEAEPYINSDGTITAVNELGDLTVRFSDGYSITLPPEFFLFEFPESLNESQPEIFVCPECGRNFAEYECKVTEKGRQCPRCQTELTKTDNGEYTNYYEGLNEEDGRQHSKLRDLDDKSDPEEELDLWTRVYAELIRAANDSAWDAAHATKVKSKISDRYEHVDPVNDSDLRVFADKNALIQENGQTVVNPEGKLAHAKKVADAYGLEYKVGYVNKIQATPEEFTYMTIYIPDPTLQLEGLGSAIKGAAGKVSKIATAAAAASDAVETSNKAKKVINGVNKAGKVATGILDVVGAVDKAVGGRHGDLRSYAPKHRKVSDIINDLSDEEKEELKKIFSEHDKE